MIGKLYKYRGYDIPWTNEMGIQKRWYADIKPDPPSTINESQIQRQDYHGVYTSPTVMQYRIVVISGEIFAVDKLTRGQARNEIREIFKVPDFPTRENEYHKLEFTDDDDTEWFLNCKVQNLPSFDHVERSHWRIFFNLSLLAEDPYFRSKELYTFSGKYGLYGGVQLPTNFARPLNFGTNAVEINNEGTQKTPVKLTVTGDIKNPKFINLSNGDFYAFDNLTLTPAEFLTIDSENFTAEVNGNNVLGLRRPGSVPLFLDPGINNFIMIGDDFEYANQDKATFTGEYRHLKI